MPTVRATAKSLIENESDIAAGVKALRRKCQILRGIHDRTGPPPLRRRQGGFKGLAQIVVAQQLSVASATAIWTRFEMAVHPMSAEAYLTASEETLKGVGLSRPKQRTLKSIAEAMASGALDLVALDLAEEEAVKIAMTAVSGIGPWTADIYMMFCQGRRDAFAPGDLALQLAVQSAFALEAKPTPAQIAEIAERWRPWRSVAARLLWAHYAFEKSREGVVDG